MGIQVRAFREGFHGGTRKRVGEEFEVPANTIESGWFAPVNASESLRPRPTPTRAQREEADKAARVKRKREDIERAKAKAGVKAPAQKPVALSQLTPKLTAREAAELLDPGVPGVPAGEDEQGDESLA